MTKRIDIMPADLADGENWITLTPEEYKELFPIYMREGHPQLTMQQWLRRPLRGFGPDFPIDCGRR